MTPGHLKPNLSKNYYNVETVDIKITRLRWAGHVMRIQDNLPCKKITLDKPEGRRQAGRPNLRWIDGVTKDAEKLGVRKWRARDRDRDDWRWLIESAKTLHGL